MTKHGTAALALLATSVAAVQPAAAQDMSGRRASLFDLGIYSGGAWTSDWFVGAEGGGVVGTSNFAELPPFDVNWSAFAGGFYGGFSTPVSRNMAVGVRAGVLFFAGDGSHQPFPGFEVTVEPRFAFYVDLEAIFRLDNLLTNDRAILRRPPTVSVFAGPAYGQVKVTGNFIGTPFSEADTQGVLGFTAGARIEIPVLPNVAATGTFRYIHLPEENFSFPGTAPVDSNMFLVTGGLKLSFPAAPAPP